MRLHPIAAYARLTIRVRRRRVVVWRYGIKGPDDSAALFPMDEQLNLPADLYSHPLRERAADEVRRGAWDQAVQQIDERTGGHVPKRQAEELTVRAAQDFEAYYEQRPQPANDTLSDRALLVLSSDSKGITMRPESLRDATRKAAEEEAADAVKGDPMASKPARRHDIADVLHGAAMSLNGLDSTRIDDPCLVLACAWRRRARLRAEANVADFCTPR